MVIIEDGLKLDFDNVLIKPRKSELISRKQVQLNVEYSFPHSKYKWSGVPIMVANMDTTGTFEMAQALSNHNVITCIHKHYSLDDWSNWLNKVQYDIPSIYDRICVSSGTSKNDIHKLSQILNFHPNLKMVMLDIANGYSQHFLDVIQEVRSLFPDKIIIAGNIVTPEMTEDLINRGADIVKGGIGPGSVCTTRKKTGIGYPQLSCVIECSQAAHRLGGLFISDGGCTCPRLLVQALISLCLVVCFPVIKNLLEKS
jgi:GMP reductase